MPAEPTTAIDLSSPRTVGEILDAAFKTYSRRPLLFIALAAIVLIPYSVVMVLVANAKHVSFGTEFVLVLVELAVVNPFVSALQMQALTDLGQGSSPVMRDVVRRGLAVLPVVAAADIIAGLAELAGFAILIVPGLFAAVRFAVVAPAAAGERIAWPEALTRSLALTRGNAWRVLGVLVIQAVLLSLVAEILGASSIAVAVAGAALWVVAQSFCALLINLLYFDLRARQVAPVA